MTPEQRYDLAIEWRMTHKSVQCRIREEYERRFGSGHPDTCWEEYLVEALNRKPFWKSIGLI